MADTTNGNGQGGKWLQAYRSLLALAMAAISAMVGAIYLGQTSALKEVAQDVKQISRDVSLVVRDLAVETNLRQAKDAEHDRRIEALERPARTWHGEITP